MSKISDPLDRFSRFFAATNASCVVAVLTRPGLEPSLRQLRGSTPLVFGLGVMASLLEGVGIGLLVPLFQQLANSGAHLGLSAFLPNALTAVLPTQNAVFLATLLIALLVFKSVVETANNFVILRLQQSISGAVRNSIAERSLKMPYQRFSSIAGGYLTNLMDEQIWLFGLAVEDGLHALQAWTSVLALGVILLLVDWRLFLILVAIGACGNLLLEAVERHQTARGIQLTGASMALSRKWKEMIDGMRTIRLLGDCSREQRNFAIFSDRLLNSHAKLRWVSAVIRPAIALVIVTTLMVILLVGYLFAVPWPILSVFLLLLTRLQPHLGTIAAVRGRLASNRASLAQISSFLSEPLLENPHPATSKLPARGDRLIFDQVSFKYAEGESALCDCSFTIEPRSITALVGPSGAGKSSIVNLICGLFTPDEGTIRYGDSNICDFDLAAWRSRIAIAGQDTTLFDATIAENIAYGAPDASRELIEDAARTAGIDRSFGNGDAFLELPIGENGLALSGGQRQRVALARAVLRQPDLLILDEATNAVDAMSETEIINLLVRKRHFNTALVISHRKQSLRACDRAIAIVDGRIVAQGKPGELEYFAKMAAD